MRLQAESPVWMGKTILYREFRIPLAFRAVHRLEQKVMKVEIFEAHRVYPLLGKDQFEFMSGAKNELSVGFRADADPIDAWWRHLGAIGLDCNLKFMVMQRVD
jgi:hypothetical protein